MAIVTSFEELALDGLRDLYDAESRMLEAFPEIVAAAASQQLRAVFDRHQRETAEHVARLERIFSHMGASPLGKECAAARGLIAEAREYIRDVAPGPLLDAVLVGAAQKFEHFEIAAYGTARTLAEQVDDDIAIRLLAQSLIEERQADEALTEVAVSVVNPAAGSRSRSVRP